MLIFPVFIPQKGCPFKCIYCDQKQFDAVVEIPDESLTGQLHQFCHANKDKQKQIAFYGGTFTALDISERDRYYKLVEPFIDCNTSIRISTRPDSVGLEELSWCKSHQITTIELGIQDFDDEVLMASKRGYDSKTAIEACIRVKQTGFELGIQLLPGLPRSTSATNTAAMVILESIKPQFLRLYPLIVLSGTELWQDWITGKYNPLSLEAAIEICADYCLFAQNYEIEVIKIGIPSLCKTSRYIGPYHPAFGELVKGHLLVDKIVSGYKPDSTIHLAAKEISLLTGHKAYNLVKLLNRLDLCSVKLKTEPEFKKGEVSFSFDQPLYSFKGKEVS